MVSWCYTMKAKIGLWKSKIERISLFLNADAGEDFGDNKEMVEQVNLAFSNKGQWSGSNYYILDPLCKNSNPLRISQCWERWKNDHQQGGGTLL